MEKALFLNGVYNDVLQDIIKSQKLTGLKSFYLQPYHSKQIQLLKKNPISVSNPIKLFISTTDNLNHICYSADIVAWDNKDNIDKHREKSIKDFLNKYQKNSGGFYRMSKGKKCINLITIKDLIHHKEHPKSTSYLIKVNGNTPLKKRSRPGNWSYVFLPPQWEYTNHNVIFEDYEKDLARKVEKSKSLSSDERKKRIESASKQPKKINIISQGFRRNPDVIVEVLAKANGICERCKKPAPFIRSKDGTPYLEIHHKIFLSNGGEDSLENAIAVCPNCHKELHYG